MTWTAITTKGGILSGYFVFIASHDRHRAFERARKLMKDNGDKGNLVAIISGKSLTHRMVSKVLFYVNFAHEPGFCKM